MSYTPPLNGGRINVTLSGNSTSAGAGYALASTGTVTLAGGNNITLSQNGNAITISGANGGGAAGTNTLGVSNLGNTVGTSGVITGSNLQLAFAGGNNITLSQSIDASSATVTVAGPYAITEAGISNLGNTAGTTATQGNKRLMLAGGNNVTLSQSVSTDGFGGASATVTMSAANQTVQTQNLHNLTLAGNSTSAGAGYAQISSGTATFAGGNNVTLSQDGNAVTISAFNQSTQTQNLIDVTLAGNSTSAGAGYALMSSGTMTLAGGNNITLSQNGNAVTISGAAGGAADGYNSAQFTNSTANSTMPVLWAGNSNGSGNITMGLTGSTVTASAAAGGGAATGLYFDNMFQQNSVQGLTFTSVSTGMFGRVLLQPLAPGNELFPYDMTISTMLMNFSNSGSSNISGAFTSSFYLGLYTRVNSTQLSLLNSVSTSYGLAANNSNSSSFLGARWLSFHSSLFSSQPVMMAGSRYIFGLLARTSSNSYASISMAGMHLGHSIQRSGYMAAVRTSATSYNAWHPFMGVHSLTTHTALPGSVANSDINKASAYANFIPQVIFDAGLGAMN